MPGQRRQSNLEGLQSNSTVERAHRWRGVIQNGPGKKELLGRRKPQKRWGQGPGRNKRLLEIRFLELNGFNYRRAFANAARFVIAVSFLRSDRRAVTVGFFANDVRDLIPRGRSVMLHHTM